MRTTLTLDDDVSSRLAQLRAVRHSSLKQIVNEVLRLGLDRLENGETTPREPYRTTPAGGEPLLSSFDDTADVIAALEGEGWR